MKAVVAAFNQEKALVGAFSVIVKTGCGTDGSFYSTSSNMLTCPLLQLTGIMNHDWVSVPLVYTQTVTLAVYAYFVAALIGGQWIYPTSDEAYKAAYGLPVGGTGAKLDLFYPFFLTIQFAFFFGWLKVAETLINPFGEDDDDFELNRLIDRHCQVGYLIVEHDETPELLQDKYWDMAIPQD